MTPAPSVATIREIVVGETATGFAAMACLRTHLTDVDAFVRQVDEVQRPDGYRLVGAFLDDAPDAVAVAGFRVSTSLSWGRFLYVDDLSTHRGARRAGHAGRLMAWIAEEAERLGVDEIHLDSGVSPDRAAAHRLYLNAGFAVRALHFARPARLG